MVRLKDRGLSFDGILNEFQFQNGTIKSSAIRAKEKADKLFQFQNGTIKREVEEFIGRQKHKFQFQNGTIKRN